MADPNLEALAQSKYGKSYADLTIREQIEVDDAAEAAGKQSDLTDTQATKRLDRAAYEEYLRTNFNYTQRRLEAELEEYDKASLSAAQAAAKAAAKGPALPGPGDFKRWLAQGKQDDVSDEWGNVTTGKPFTAQDYAAAMRGVQQATKEANARVAAGESALKGSALADLQASGSGAEVAKDGSVARKGSAGDWTFSQQFDYDPATGYNPMQEVGFTHPTAGSTRDPRGSALGTELSTAAAKAGQTEAEFNERVRLMPRHERDAYLRSLGFEPTEFDRYSPMGGEFPLGDPMDRANKAAIEATGSGLPGLGHNERVNRFGPGGTTPIKTSNAPTMAASQAEQYRVLGDFAGSKTGKSLGDLVGLNTDMGTQTGMTETSASADSLGGVGSDRYNAEAAARMQEMADRQTYGSGTAVVNPIYWLNDAQGYNSRYNRRYRQADGATNLVGSLPAADNGVPRVAANPGTLKGLASGWWNMYGGLEDYVNMVGKGYEKGLGGLGAAYGSGFGQNYLWGGKRQAMGATNMIGMDERQKLPGLGSQFVQAAQQPLVLTDGSRQQQPSIGVQAPSPSMGGGDMSGGYNPGRRRDGTQMGITEIVKEQNDWVWDPELQRLVPKRPRYGTNEGSGPPQGANSDYDYLHYMQDGTPRAPRLGNMFGFGNWSLFGNGGTATAGGLPGLSSPNGFQTPNPVIMVDAVTGEELGVTGEDGDEAMVNVPLTRPATDPLAAEVQQIMGLPGLSQRTARLMDPASLIQDIDLPTKIGAAALRGLKR